MILDVVRGLAVERVDPMINNSQLEKDFSGPRVDDCVESLCLSDVAAKNEHRTRQS